MTEISQFEGWLIVLGTILAFFAGLGVGITFF